MSGLREALRVYYADLCAAFSWTIHGPGAEWECPWPAQVAAIEAGEPVEVAGFEIPTGFRGDACRWGSATRSACRRRCTAVHPFDRFVVAPDGSLREG